MRAKIFSKWTTQTEKICGTYNADNENDDVPNPVESPRAKSPGGISSATLPVPMCRPCGEGFAPEECEETPMPTRQSLLSSQNEEKEVDYSDPKWHPKNCQAFLQ